MGPSIKAEHLLVFAMYCVCDSLGLLPACSGCSETLGHVSLSMQLSFQMTPLPTLWTLWNTAVETHVLSVVGVTAIPSQNSMTAVCCGWRDQLGSLSP